MEDEKFASLKLMADLSGVEAQVKPYLTEWILITYDLPTTEEGNKARAEFLETVWHLGGVMHSKSCYLMPSTPEAELAAVRLAEVTKSAYIWFSSIKDEAKARELTEEYDKAIKDDILKELKERITKMKKHAEDGKEAVVNRMRKKTEKLIKDAAGIAARRGSEKLAKEVSRLKSEYEEITVNTTGSWVSELKDLL